MLLLILNIIIILKAEQDKNIWIEIMMYNRWHKLFWSSKDAGNIGEARNLSLRAI